MRALRKMVVTGAVGGLGVATAIASGAFACTAVPRVQTFFPGTTNDAGALTPGETIDVRISGYPTGGVIEVKWKGANGDEMTFPTGPLAGPSFVATIKVPETARDGDFLYAPQSGIAQNETVPPASFQVAMPPRQARQSESGPALPPPAAPVTTVAPNANPGPILPGPTLPAPQNGKAPLTNSRRAVAAPGGQPAATPHADAAPVPASATDAKKPADRTGAPVVGSPAAPLVAGAPVPGQPVAAPADLWSGLTSTDQAPSLLDQAAPQRHGGGIPVGAILFGSGLVALAGVAIATGRRQLAHSHIVRR